MPTRNRFGYAALGFVAGLGLALLFLVWAVPGFRYPANGDVGQADTQKADQRQGDPVVPSSLWDVHTSPEDTYAQWIMAAVALIATGVSIWAVRLVRKTLVATQHGADAAWEAVKITRQSAEQQLRAYVSVERMDPYLVVGQRPAVHVRLKNTGMTPARKVALTYKGLPAENPDAVRIHFDSVPRKSILQVGPQGIINFTVRGENILSEETFAAVQAETIYFVIGALMVYRDIFGKTRRLVLKGYVTIDGDSAAVTSCAKGNRGS